MTAMTDAAALALRKPFPPESVGKLPKGGVMLDYVGHAAVTDRLLTVDPNWSWEPFALGPDGLPAADREGNLWIKLTICGVTRIGVGDGKSAKERIGDAIRNAAMRFGVALDLWAKENLVEFATAAHAPKPKANGTEQRDFPPPAEDAPTMPEQRSEPTAAEAAMTKAQRSKMFALFGELGIPEDQQLPGINHITEAAYASRGDLTKADAKRVIDTLEARKAAQTGADA